MNELISYLLDFKINDIPSETRFWMIRTKKGYFYNEFISKKFVALAWNLLTKDTNFSESYTEFLSDSIFLEYPEIKRPKLVINKCNSFIHEIKEGDILVIPSNGSKYITFARAGAYYEEESKNIEIEKEIIQRIEHGQATMNTINCPYRKRRHITPIRTIKSDEVNYHLYKAISSYHGISNFDEYGTIILDHLFNCYSFNDTTRLVFHVSKPDAISSKEFSGFLYSVNSILSCTGIDEAAISTQASVHSIGDIVFTIKNLYTWLSDNYLFLVAIVATLGGGSFLTVKLPGVPAIIKDFLSIKVSKEKADTELNSLKLEQYEKAIKLKKMLDEQNMTLEEFQRYMDTLISCSSSMMIQPLETIEEPSISDADNIQTDNEEEQL